MACVVMAVIITLSLVLGAELGSKANPTTTTYVPRPEWYFFFLFELLRVIKPPALVPLATIGVPTICMILLFLLPFYDRGPERRPERRPIATTTGIFVIGAMAYLTYSGRERGLADGDRIRDARGRRRRRAARRCAQYEAGKLVVAQSGCEACHKIGDNGNAGPGPDLTHIASRLPRQAIARTLVNPTAPMPSFKNLPPAEVPSDRQLPLAAQVAGRCQLAREPAAGKLEAGQVRAMFDRIAGVYDPMNTAMTAGLHHRWRARAVELGARRPGQPRARRRDRHRRSGDRARAARGAGRRGDRLRLRRGDARARARARRRPAIRASCGRASNGPTRWRCPTTTDSLRRGHRRLRRAQLRRPRARARGDGAGRAPGRAGRGARDHDADAAAAVVLLPPWFDRLVPALGRLTGALARLRGDPAGAAGIADAYSYLPNSVKRFPAPARARRRAGARGPRRTSPTC